MHVGKSGLATIEVEIRSVPTAKSAHDHEFPRPRLPTAKSAHRHECPQPRVRAQGLTIKKDHILTRRSFGGPRPRAAAVGRQGGSPQRSASTPLPPIRGVLREKPLRGAERHSFFLSFLILLILAILNLTSSGKTKRIHRLIIFSRRHPTCIMFRQAGPGL